VSVRSHSTAQWKILGRVLTGESEAKRLGASIKLLARLAQQRWWRWTKALWRLSVSLVSGLVGRQGAERDENMVFGVGAGRE
jgi:hypothetical protein